MSTGQSNVRKTWRGRQNHINNSNTNTVITITIMSYITVTVIIVLLIILLITRVKSRGSSARRINRWTLNHESVLCGCHALENKWGCIHSTPREALLLACCHEIAPIGTLRVLIMGIKAPYSPSPYPPSGPYDCMKPQCRSSSLGMALGTEKLQHRKLSALMEFRGLRFRL